MLEILAKNHNLWVRMVINMGCQKDVAEDIVQSMYLRIHRLVEDGKRIMYNDEEVNRFFIYITLKNMFIDYMKAKNKYTFFEFLENDLDADDRFVVEEFNIEKDNGFSFITKEVYSEINTWDRYDIILAHLYLKSDYSLRDIANGSGISLTSIYNSIKNYKSILKNKFGEHWEDYTNGDWHLLKDEYGKNE
jgi:DNA-directed RNA polymerase specialized sigma24 family protein